MQREEINILVVDDDVNLGKAVREAFTRAGFKALHVTRPDEALSTLKIQSFQGAVIDCMLPKMNGRELAKQIRAEWPEIPIILMSGIYKDKNFARDAMQECGAAAFLTKPFDLKDLVGTLEAKLETKIDTPLAPMQALLMKEAISHKERIKSINDAEEVHGYDLPWVFSLLFHARVNGHLNIISPDGDVCGVGFQGGRIVQVNQKDSKSYFGVLMVEYGFISQEELEEVMRVTGGKQKKMGERLVESNVLSPHAIQIVMAEQQGLRLSKTVTDSGVKINFVESDELREDALTDRTVYTELLNEWLVSKIKLDWLKSSYLPWMRYNLKQNSEYVENHRVFSIPVVQRAPGLMKYLMSKQTLEQALSDTTVPEEQFYPALHALMISRVLRFGEATIVTDTTAQKKRLSRLIIDLEKQNYFERLHVISKAKDADIKRSYHELAKILHPDKLPKETTNEIRELTKKCFALISSAYDVLSDPDKKASYLLELEKGKASSILESEQMIEAARPLLTKGDFKKAKELLDAAIALAPPTSEGRLFSMWARMKATPSDKVNTSVRDELGQIPPEDRHTPTFYFVRGLNLRLLGDTENAKKNLAHAVSLDPDFIDAKREMMVANNAKAASAPASNDLLRGDLKDVVGMLFKKKK
jgi:CheY-like chemotaxis protein/curved DNA-binding protein CbpA